MLKKISYLLIIFVLMNCSSNDDSSEKITPVNSTHLLWGKWNIKKIENSDGASLYNECDISDLYVEFLKENAVWRRARINNNGCASSNYNYYDWIVNSNVGYVDLYSQGTAGSSYRHCEADLIGDNGLRLCIVQIRNGESSEVISTIPVAEREYYYFTKTN